MNRQQVALIIAKASVAYPNQAIDLEEEPQVFELWCEMLKGVDAQLALSNVDNHILTQKFFPTIADIAQKSQSTFYDHDNRLLEQKLLLIEESSKTAVDPPQHIIDRWCKRE